jgi:hypothetical protein
MLLGSAASVFVSVGSYQLFSSFYQIPSAQFPVPTAQIWLDMAKLVSSPSSFRNVFSLPSSIVLIERGWRGTLLSINAGAPPSDILLALRLKFQFECTISKVGCGSGYGIEFSIQNLSLYFKPCKVFYKQKRYYIF